MSSDTQGTNKAPTRHQQAIVTAGVLPERDKEAITSQRIRERILEAVDEGDKSWNCPPGALPWHAARQALGGAVRTARFQAEVHRLIADSRLVEVWLETEHLRQRRHLLVAPGCRKMLRRRVVKVRASRGVYDREYADVR